MCFFVMVYYINCVPSLLLCTYNFSVNEYATLYVLQMDTGFIVWSFQGRQLYRNPVVIDKFCQLLWRPRPPTLLTDDHIKVCNFVYLHIQACMYDTSMFMSYRTSRRILKSTITSLMHRIGLVEKRLRRLPLSCALVKVPVDACLFYCRKLLAREEL